MKKIFMFTSVHPRNDTRIFYKEAVSLAKRYFGKNIQLTINDNCKFIRRGKKLKNFSWFLPKELTTDRGFRNANKNG